MKSISKQVLEELKTSPPKSITEAASRLGVSRSTLYRWLGEDGNFYDEIRGILELRDGSQLKQKEHARVWQEGYDRGTYDQREFLRYSVKKAFNDGYAAAPTVDEVLSSFLSNLENQIRNSQTSFPLVIGNTLQLIEKTKKEAVSRTIDRFDSL